MTDIDRSRAAMRRRIAKLDKKHCKDADDLQNTLNELVKLNIADLRESVAAAVIECMNRYAVAGTPVETGRARAGWHVTSEQMEIGFTPPLGLSKEEYRQMIANNIGRLDLTNYERIYVINNVEYILALNAGWSKKQAGNFIDRFLQELGEMLNKMAANK